MFLYNCPIINTYINVQKHLKKTNFFSQKEVLLINCLCNLKRIYLSKSIIVWCVDIFFLEGYILEDN